MLSPKSDLQDEWQEIDDLSDTGYVILDAYSNQVPQVECSAVVMDEEDQYLMVDWSTSSAHSSGSSSGNESAGPSHSPQTSPPCSPVLANKLSSSPHRYPPRRSHSRRALPPTPTKNGSSSPHRPRPVVVVPLNKEPIRCYAPTCGLDSPCYSYSCPYKSLPHQRSSPPPRVNYSEPGIPFRQRLINVIVTSEKSYARILDFVDSVSFLILQRLDQRSRDQQDIVKPLYFLKPPILQQSKLNDFMIASLSGILSMRKCHRGCLDALSDRCYAVGDVLLGLVEELRPIHLAYVAKLPWALDLLKSETESNAAFALFSFFVSERLSLLEDRDRPDDMEQLFNFPVRHLEKLEVMLNDLLLVTASEHPDVAHLKQAIQIIHDINQTEFPFAI
ncbi:Dbl homology domain-containing protein [Mycena floridula]|nr:Dbl homology domain-containing protein [Mycena floridula]